MGHLPQGGGNWGGVRGGHWSGSDEWKFGRIGVDQWRCKFSHSLDLHVAALEQPLVVLLEQDSADQPGDAGFVGEDADDIGAPLDLFVKAFERVGAVQFGSDAGLGR